MNKGPIGVFDSGMGGLTVYKRLKESFPIQDFIYLGDHARAPYGSRSFETIYEYTLNAIQYLFSQNCPLIIIACNTASARALRTIQQQYLPANYPNRRVLGVIRPMAEALAESSANNIGLLATSGTVRSDSYRLELQKLNPNKTLVQTACPLLVPLIENDELTSPPLNYFLKKYLDELLLELPNMDSLVLGCTHYPLLIDKIPHLIPPNIQIFEHGTIVANKLGEYLSNHPEIKSLLSEDGKESFRTTEDPTFFDKLSLHILNRQVNWVRIHL